MPQINVLPSAYRDGGAREKAAAAIAAQAETVKCADILSSLSRLVAELCRECRGNEEDADKALDAFEKAVEEKSAEVSGEEASLLIREVSAELREKLLKRCVGQEILSSFAKRADTLETAIESYARYLREFPDSYAGVCADFAQLTDEAGLPEAVKEILFCEAEKKFAAGVLKGKMAVSDEAVRAIFQDGKFSEIFTDKEQKELALLMAKKNGARAIYSFFGDLKKLIAASQNEEQGILNARRRLEENPRGLNEDALNAVQVLLEIFLRQKAVEEQSERDSEITFILQETKRIFEEFGQEEAFAFWISGEIEMLDADIYAKVLKAFENGSVGNPSDRSGFGRILASFAKGEADLCENGLLTSYLSGEIGNGDFGVLSSLSGAFQSESALFFFKKTIEKIFERVPSDLAAALSEGVAERFKVLVESGAGLLEIKSALDACIGG